MQSTGEMDPVDSSGGDHRDPLDTPAIHCGPGPEGGEAGDKKKPALVIKEDYIQESGGAQKPK